MLTQLLAAGVTLAVFAFLIWAIMRAAARGGQMEERAEQAEDTARAVQRDAESDRQATERMADVQAASVGEPVQSARERMRARPRDTR
jgi:biopolymer transport protein ExbB/TolQ